MLRLIWYRFIIYRLLPEPLRYAARMAWFIQTQTEARDAGHRDIWLDALEYQWRRWLRRAADPVIMTANQLHTDGWNLSSDWPLIPPAEGLLVYDVRLAKGAHPEVDKSKIVFLWDTEEEARSVPFAHVYGLLDLPHENGRQQEIAWEVCFWLAFLTSDTLQKDVEEETRQHRQRRKHA